MKKALMFGMVKTEGTLLEKFRMLKEVGYDGFLTAEVFPYAHHGDAILRHTSESMDRILGRNKP